MLLIRIRIYLAHCLEEAHDGFETTLIKRAYMIEEMRGMAVEAGWINPRIESAGMGFEAWLKK